VPPPPAPPPPPFKIPPGCQIDLSGAYHHQDNETFRYQVTDDGGEATVLAYRQFGETRVDIPDGGPGLIHLRRSDRGFSGESSSYGKTQSGKLCQVAWPYEVTACSPTSLTVRTPQDFGLKEDCGIDQPDMAEDILVRDGSPALDAGPDAGVAQAVPGADGGSVAPADAGRVGPSGAPSEPRSGDR
jgi:hypothetical protein